MSKIRQIVEYRSDNGDTHELAVVKVDDEGNFFGIMKGGAPFWGYQKNIVKVISDEVDANDPE